MKNIIIIIAILVATGCKKQLEENPPARFAVTNLNPSVLNALVVGAYEPMVRSRGRLWESTLGIVVEGLGEYCRILSTNTNTNFANYNFTAYFDNMASTWTTFYETIGKCNLLLQTIENDQQMAAADKQVAKGEALFIRSTCYYWLVRLWGKVPMRLTPVQSSDNVGLPLSAVEAIYAQITKDLQFAETVLPAKVSSAQAGRATAGAAKAALADIYLTLKDYPNARTKAREIIDNKGAYGYDLVTDLSILYSPTAATNSEDVFSLKFAQISGYGSFLPTYAAEDRAKAAGLAARGLFFMGVKKVPLVRDWDTRDKRRSLNLLDSVIIAGVRVPAHLVDGYDYFFAKYQDPNAADEVGAGNDFYLFRYADALLIYAEAENQLNGPTAAAYDAINQVRRRAYGVPVATPSSLADLPSGLSKQQFDDLVFRERGYEFFFENKRWFDMQRTGRAADLATAAGKTAPKDRYLIIPSVEVSNNPALR